MVAHSSFPVIPVGLIEFFVYPRILYGVRCGYDTGYFEDGKYKVLAWVQSRAFVEEQWIEWAIAKNCPITIEHEEDPSESKDGQEREI